MDKTLPDILSPEHFAKVMEWLRSETGTPTPDTVHEFVNALNAEYSKRTGRSPRLGAGSRLSLQAILSEAENAAKQPTPRPQYQPNSVLEDISREPQTAPADNARRFGDDKLPLQDEQGFTEAHLDSCLLARAIAWHWQQLDRELTGGRNISTSYLQTLLYTIYGTCLAERGTRLTDERPRMWKYGPVFPKPYKQFAQKGVPADPAAAALIRHSDPTLDEFLSRIVRITAEKRIKDLTLKHTSASSPWGICLRQNPDKWNTELDDRLIADWFRKDIDKHS